MERHHPQEAAFVPETLRNVGLLSLELTAMRSLPGAPSCTAAGRPAAAAPAKAAASAAAAAARHFDGDCGGLFFRMPRGKVLLLRPAGGRSSFAEKRRLATLLGLSYSDD